MNVYFGHIYIPAQSSTSRKKYDIAKTSTGSIIICEVSLYKL